MSRRAVRCREPVIPVVTLLTPPPAHSSDLKDQEANLLVLFLMRFMPLLSSHTDRQETDARRQREKRNKHRGGETETNRLKKETCNQRQTDAHDMRGKGNRNTRETQEKQPVKNESSSIQSTHTATL